MFSLEWANQDETPDTRPGARLPNPSFSRRPFCYRRHAADRASEWLARLDALEAKLADDRIGDFTIWDWVPYSDGVSEEHLRRNRAALLAVIAESREFYQRRLDAAPPAR